MTCEARRAHDICHRFRTCASYSCHCSHQLTSASDFSRRRFRTALAAVGTLNSWVAVSDHFEELVRSGQPCPCVSCERLSCPLRRLASYQGTSLFNYRGIESRRFHREVVEDLALRTGQLTRDVVLDRVSPLLSDQGVRHLFQ